MRALGWIEGIAMRVSVFSSISKYFADVSHGLKSVLNAFSASLPYVIGVGELRKEVTEQYPDPISSKTPDDLPSRSRGILFNDIERCTGCRECENVCPPRAIRIETEPGPDMHQLWVSTFDVDVSKCILCGICVEVCLPRSLVHTKKSKDAVYQVTDLISSFGKGSITPELRSKWEFARKMTENDEVMI